MADEILADERHSKRRGKAVCGCVAVVVAVPVILVVLYVGAMLFAERKHSVNRERMKSPLVAPVVAHDLALLCQSLPEETTDDGMGFLWLPKSVRDCNPHWGRLGPEGAHLEMHGGFDHYGYRLDKHPPGSNATEITWDLSLYTESGDGGFLCSVVLKANERLTVDQLVARGLEGYDIHLRDAPADLDVFAEKLQFLLHWRRLEDALAACLVAEKAVPDHWLPRLTAAHLAGRLGWGDILPRKFTSWVHANPDFSHFTCLFLYDLREGKPPEALAAIREAIGQPFVETPTTPKSKYYLGCSAAVYAQIHGDSALATAVCDYMEAGGPAGQPWAGEIKKIRSSIASNDPGLEGYWLKERDWPNLYSSNSTEKESSSVLYPAAPTPGK